ncbi:MAG: nuclear transport factor 2 family protein [Opitutales bacterium]
MEKLSYAEMLALTAPEVVGGTVVPESPEAEAAIERFRRFFSDLTVDRVEEECARVYARDAILHDTLVTHQGIDEILPYFRSTAERAAGVNVTIDRTVRDGSDYFIQWTMDITWKGFGKGRTTRSVGMSHLRFNAAGEVVLHHDFWDSTSGFFEHLPVIGGLLRWIKRRVGG